jgi:hypothetical protein
MIPYRDVCLVVYPFLTIRELDEGTTSNGWYACFMMRPKWDKSARGWNEWMTVRVKTKNQDVFESVKEAIEVGRKYVDREVYLEEYRRFEPNQG